MVKRSFAGLLAGICVISNAALVPSGSVSAEGSDSYSMKVSVDLTAEKQTISPYIYGVNAFDASSLKNVTVNNIRQGGNRYTGYNWETNWSNAGEDWHNSSDTNIGDDTQGPAAAVQKLSQMAEKNSVPYKLATLQMAGYVSADKNGTVKADEVAPSSRWNKVVFKKEGELSLEPDLTDGTVYMDEYVNYIMNKLGDAASETGIQGYSLDNEPVLWNDTHPLMHPEEVSSKELISKSIELAKVVKSLDPKAEIFGPAFWGMLPCMNCGDGSDIKDASGQKIGTYTDEDWAAVKSNYFWFTDYYLEQMAKAEQESGQRLLDVFDVHYYSQGINNDDDILQAARSLYDPTYVEDSWLQPWGKDYFPFLSVLQKSIEKYYPGTKLAISEYNLGNIGNEKVTGKNIRTGLAEAEALGAFALNNVYFATYWGTLSECPYVESAINLYTNYDGEGGKFGDNLVKTSTEDLSKSAAFASIDGNDTSEVKVVITNKDLTKSEKAEIKIAGGAENYKSAVVYAISDDHSDIRVIDVQNDLSGDTITVELPPLTAAQVVISDKATDKTLYVEPEKPDVKEVVFKFDELEMSQNNFPMIPIEDAAALKKVIINTTASCSTGATWYGGGGGLCFNKLVTADGASHWGMKSFSYGGGTGDNVVLMDGTFDIPIDTTTTLEGEPATIKDTFIEFQDWWKSSTNDDKGADVTVTYNTITMVYEYEKQGTSDPSSEDSTGKDILYGDANCDNEVNMADAVFIMQTISNPDKYQLTEKGEANADVDGSKDITNMDALTIQKLKLNIIDKFPVA